ncbi:hypothetical protein AOLI_G00309610 [Acnodon oligacanthus]
MYSYEARIDYCQQVAISRPFETVSVFETVRMVSSSNNRADGGKSKVSLRQAVAKTDKAACAQHHPPAITVQNDTEPPASSPICPGPFEQLRSSSSAEAIRLLHFIPGWL